MSTRVLIFRIGQCWASQTEPELGLGFIVEISQLSITVTFPETTERRMYGVRSAPLRRVRYDAGEQIRVKGGKAFEVAEVIEQDGLLIYRGEGHESLESELEGGGRSQTQPQERIFSGRVDDLRKYRLRLDTLRFRARTLNSPSRGLVGPRVTLLPHQLYVASQVVGHPVPRALLADEVGLGKTIEAGLTLHRLLVTERARKVLIVVPSALSNQWFVELFRRFNLLFTVVNAVDTAGAEEDLRERALCLISMEALKGSERLRAVALELSWDLMIVDEAHRIQWFSADPEDVDSVGLSEMDAAASIEENEEYGFYLEMARKVEGVLLLTATPEQLGHEGHFARLHLLDPDRYPSLSAFHEEQESYSKLMKALNALPEGDRLSAAKVNPLLKKFPVPGLESAAERDDGKFSAREIVRALVDRYGTGRSFFRNTRSRVAQGSVTFPKRHVHPHALDPSKKGGNAKMEWLAEFLRENPSEKVLLITHADARVTEIETELKRLVNVKTASFHAQQPILVRDRQAAYFAEPEGARILICSEMGSEGRNFQFAAHLVLFDLPMEPDVLEQRIGRLDRIGQRRDIHIHVPFEKGSTLERLFRWYHEEGLDALRAPAPGAAQLADRIHLEWSEVLLSGTAAAFEKFLKRGRKEIAEIQAQLEAGRDSLVELQSFDPDVGAEIVKRVKDFEDPEELREYMEQVFDLLGVTEEELDDDSSFVQPGDLMYIPHFPGLPDDGLRLTYSRDKALAREELTLLTWDHPMVSETLGMLLSGEFGNACVATWRTPPAKDTLLLELCFVLEPLAIRGASVERWLPPTLIRIVAGPQGEDLSSQWDRRKLEPLLKTADAQRMAMLKRLPKGVIAGLIQKAEGRARAQGAKIRDAAWEESKSFFAEERNRLVQLKTRMGEKRATLAREKRALDDWEAKVKDGVERASVRLDAVRLIF
ncbi:MAG: DEAD/DEAH box helicase family protein [Bdellovibrionales bacterium]|nr:DEAD/DEAH box helicase family protein [Bdellovibrionales bacterium]